jgi:adenosylhomocysteine nucleosidase
MDDLVVFTALGWERRAVTGGPVAFSREATNAWSGRLPDGRRCRVIQTGIGPARARRAADAAPPAARWLMAGCAGALVPGLAAGEVVVASSILSLDDTGHVVEQLPADGGLVAAWLVRRGLAVRDGAIASSPVVLATPAAKAAAAAAGAVAVDMESAGIAAVARERGTPFLSLRVVLDVAGQALPLAALADGAAGEVRMARLILGLAVRPSLWPSVARLARQTRVAERRLRAVFAALFADGGLGSDNLGLARTRHADLRDGRTRRPPNH